MVTLGSLKGSIRLEKALKILISKINQKNIEFEKWWYNKKIYFENIRSFLHLKSRGSEDEEHMILVQSRKYRPRKKGVA